MKTSFTYLSEITNSKIISSIKVPNNIHSSIKIINSQSSSKFTVAYITLGWDVHISEVYECDSISDVNRCIKKMNSKIYNSGLMFRDHIIEVSGNFNLPSDDKTFFISYFWEYATDKKGRLTDEKTSEWCIVRFKFKSPI